MGSSPPIFPQDKLPYRVIDVEATLSSKGSFRFCQADSMSDFCVVSHMWNDHVTKLMEEIKGAAKLYSEAVTSKNWADVQATREVYLSIKEFLSILQEQGVKKAWIDVLCINQNEDSDEMTREIPLMGAYYRHSSACYTPVHGFGLNYRLPLGEMAMTNTLPWINRVWTLQEFLLPDRFYFVVEMEEWMEEWLALRVATAGTDLAHFCSCCMGDDFKLGHGDAFTLQKLKTMSRKMQMQDPTPNYIACQVKEKIMEADLHRTCDHCGSPPLLIKARTKAPDCMLYLVRREAIFSLVWLAQYHQFILHSIAGHPVEWWKEPDDQNMASFEEVWNIRVFARKRWLLDLVTRRAEGWFHVSEILAEVSNRQCMKEQDRVRGVLGLLGVSQMITHKDLTLEEQLVQLACAGVFPEPVLVELCCIDIHSGRSMPQMSWIPDLTAKVSTLEYGSRDFRSSATNVSVTPQGPITFTVKLLKGYATLPRGTFNGWTANSLSWKANLSDHRLYFEHPNYSNPASRLKKYAFQYREWADQGPEELGFLILPFKRPTNFYGFEMWLLYVGHTHTEATVLLCLHKRGAGNVVHKIGILRPNYLGKRKVLEDLMMQDPPQEVTIAGYGRRLDDHVDYDPPLKEGQ